MQNIVLTFQLLPQELFTSSLSDIHGAITGAIASLKGPLAWWS
jgi:hypothetical protein